MLTAFLLSATFLVSYVIYHAQGLEVRFGDQNGDGVLSPAELVQAGVWRQIYFAILISHILLSAVILPFILMSYYLGWQQRIQAHKRLVHFVWPAWLYVTISGVLVYCLLAPYYPG